MADSGHVDIEKVKAVVQFWRYWKDTPFALDEDFRRLFG
jgi:hypothetical protein